jgi:D-xylono/L-arabinono-1,4-lactonase
MEPEMVADYACQTGEGPLWHPDEKRLYWVDIPNGKMFWYDPATGAHEQCYEGEPIGGITLQADGALLLFMARGAVKTWRGGELETVISEMSDERESRFNDVIAAPDGGVFCGTMPTPDRLGRLYRLETDGTIVKLLDGIGCSNGMGFTPERKRMYYTDSPARAIYLFDYEEESGEISNQRVFVRVPEDEGSPDGMTVDAEGCVWSARWGGSCLVRYTPEGEEQQRVSFPVKKVSCITFGGEEYADAYVTTAGGNDKAAEGALAGALFRVRLGVSGVPEFRSRIGL